ncbi:hypothetical protein N7447_003613 [Penicillium robsamsonii]|uniref:uncharacterized protein n=1 Tax=Penicillium robsamsonii TaxID=1792511 RepID=UPI00254807A4|nr:uncharacterized protein N7447_003613 [Penicillium robsamsonii]KAJ5826850.1 hypothetical protein N7447_003613 [Penicillium robsamsonii]
MAYQQTNHLTVFPDDKFGFLNGLLILAFKPHEIVMGLKETIHHKSRRSSMTLNWSPIVEQIWVDSVDEMVFDDESLKNIPMPV